MNQENPTSIFVDQFYEMDPEFDEVLFDGTMLRKGMVVLIESTMMREDPERINHPTLGGKYALDRLRTFNRWCTVRMVKVTPRWQEDNYGSIVESSPLVEFLARYPDGTLKKRTMDASYAWIVKKDSIPKDEEMIDE